MHLMEHYSAMKRDAVLTDVTTRVYCESMSSARGWTQKVMHSVTAFVGNARVGKAAG
jgi:hypothetical protein